MFFLVEYEGYHPVAVEADTYLFQVEKNNNMSVFFIHVAWVLSEDTAKISSCSVSVCFFVYFLLLFWHFLSFDFCHLEIDYWSTYVIGNGQYLQLWGMSTRNY